jgi:amino acid transporter
MCHCSGGAIGAGLFINSGSAFQQGGPASVLLGFLIVGTSDWLFGLRRGH